MAINERTIQGGSWLSDEARDQIQTDLRAASARLELSHQEVETLVGIALRKPERAIAANEAKRRADEAEKTAAEIGKNNSMSPYAEAKLADAAVRASVVGGYVKLQDDSKALTFFFDLGKRLQ